VYYHNERKIINTKETVVTINITEEIFIYLTGHIINDKNLFPATGYLFLLWEMMAALKRQEHTNVPIVFEDVNFIRATMLSQQNEIELTFLLQEGNITTQAVKFLM